MPKKSESADIEEPKLENEGTIEEELNVNISPTPADIKSPTSKTTKVGLIKISRKKKTQQGLKPNQFKKKLLKTGLLMFVVLKMLNILVFNQET